MYMNEMNSDLLDFEKHSGFRARSALSREETNADGSRRYVQHRMFDEGEELWELMRDGRALVYQCGLKGMDHGVDETMHKLARAHGQDWTALKEEWKLAGLWNVEVY
jgi:sulfite reductase alpha subunit-like flavoprotein